MSSQNYLFVTWQYTNIYLHGVCLFSPTFYDPPILGLLFNNIFLFVINRWMLLFSLVSFTQPDYANFWLFIKYTSEYVCIISRDLKKLQNKSIHDSARGFVSMVIYFKFLNKISSCKNKIDFLASLLKQGPVVQKNKVFEFEISQSSKTTYE